MAWECAVCGVSERPDAKPPITVDVVCHHCGKPLCNNHRKKLPDDAFWADAPVNRTNAFHCPDCHKRYHPKVQALVDARP